MCPVISPLYTSEVKKGLADPAPPGRCLCCLLALLPNYSTLHRSAWPLLWWWALCPIFNLYMDPELIKCSSSCPTLNNLLTGSERTSPQGLLTQSCQMLLLTREADLTSSALLHVWLNTKTSCVGPVHQAILAALSNSLSFVHLSARICPMQKFYLQLFDSHCSIRCKHWITFDLQPNSSRIILGSSPLIASFVICYLATLSFTLHTAHPFHWDTPFNTMCHEIKCFLKIYYI